ncbi:hypothetical protein KIW84_021687 [Lathyrus oleraceus]|uniref:DNA2/NAM7 helicase-like C-terminal domain-containing protein n=1 Tax=Pisum sativum TaxID=3888 RepID=A0A9D4Y979_PEA|nr:hypothetical protein KIW84_021687 [Pisum sativum]
MKRRVAKAIPPNNQVSGTTYNNKKATISSSSDLTPLLWPRHDEITRIFNLNDSGGPVQSVAHLRFTRVLPLRGHGRMQPWVGNAKTVHQNSLPFFIDTLVGQRISEDRMPSKDGKNDLRVDSSALLQSNMEKLIDYIRFYETKCANLRAGHPVIMLTEQYRMHPEICKFPSSHFYDNKLLNGSQMSSKSTPCHQTEGLGPYAFYDIVDGREAHEETLVQCRFVMNAKLMLRLKY